MHWWAEQVASAKKGASTYVRYKNWTLREGGCASQSKAEQRDESRLSSDNCDQRFVGSIDLDQLFIQHTEDLIL